jgi:soluble lytic murein transglycosylase-like protein
MRHLGKLGQSSSSIQTQIIQAANVIGVPSSIALAVAQIESEFNPIAVSPTGAQGIFQLEPATAAQLGVTNAFDPTQNIQGGLTYLQQLYQKYGDWTTALAAYNWGPGNVDKTLAASPGSPAIPSSVQGYAFQVLSIAGENDATVATGSDASTSDATSVDPSSVALFALAALVAGVVWWVWD